MTDNIKLKELKNIIAFHKTLMDNTPDNKREYYDELKRELQEFIDKELDPAIEWSHENRYLLNDKQALHFTILFTAVIQEGK